MKVFKIEFYRVFSRNLQEESQGPLRFWIRGPKQNFCHQKFIYTVMSCRSCASQGRIAFHFLLPKLIFCLKYAIFCVNENPEFYICTNLSWYSLNAHLSSILYLYLYKENKNPERLNWDFILSCLSTDGETFVRTNVTSCTNASIDQEDQHTAATALHVPVPEGTACNVGHQTTKVSW